MYMTCCRGLALPAYYVGFWLHHACSWDEPSHVELGACTIHCSRRRDQAGKKKPNLLKTRREVLAGYLDSMMKGLGNRAADLN